MAVGSLSRKHVSLLLVVGILAIAEIFHSQRLLAGPRASLHTVIHTVDQQAEIIKSIPQPQPQQQQPQQQPRRRWEPKNPPYNCTYGIHPGNQTTVVVPYGHPTFVVIGVQKAGTTALLELFRDHPDVVAPREELHFFQYWGTRVAKGAKRRGLNTGDPNDAGTSCYALERYMALFPKDWLLTSPRKLYSMEKTPIYIADEKNAHLMKRTVPWTKVLVILRNPVDRAYSHYKMTLRGIKTKREPTFEELIYKDIRYMRNKSMTTAPLPVVVDADGTNSSFGYYEIPPVPFDHAVLDSSQWDLGHNRVYSKKKTMFESMVGRGLYGHQLEHWLRNYTLGVDLMVLNYDDLKRDTKKVYEQILGFVGIPLASRSIDFHKTARTDDRREHRPLSKETRRYLTEFYAPYNAKLESLLGPSWSPANLGWD